MSETEKMLAEAVAFLRIAFNDYEYDLDRREAQRTCRGDVRALITRYESLATQNSETPTHEQPHT